MKCIVCGNDNIVENSIDKKIVFSCRNCKATFRVYDKTEKFYDENYFKKCYVGKNNDISRFVIAQRYCDELKSFKSSGKLLEIGCAGGHLLKVCEERGFDVTGIEIGKFAADYAKKKFGLRVINGDTDHIMSRIPAKSFDAVIMINLLENVKNPLKVMQNVNRILKDNGIVLFCIPNYSSLFKHGYPELRTTFFRTISVKIMCRNSGFEIISYRTRFFSYMADVSLQKVSGFMKKYFMKPGAIAENKYDSMINISKPRFSNVARIIDMFDKTPWGISTHVVLKKAI